METDKSVSVINVIIFVCLYFSDCCLKVFDLSTQSTDIEIVDVVRQLSEAAKQTTTSDVSIRATDAEVFELSTALNFVAELVPADSLAATNVGVLKDKIIYIFPAF